MSPIRFTCISALLTTFALLFMFPVSASAQKVPPGKPTYSGSTEGYLIQAWVIPGIKARALIEKGKVTFPKEDIGQGTHVVFATARKDKKSITVDDAEVWFHIIYPNGKNWMPQLKGTGSLFGGAVALDQKGTYTLMVHVNTEEEHPAVTFKYVVK